MLVRKDQIRLQARGGGLWLPKPSLLFVISDTMDAPICEESFYLHRAGVGRDWDPVVRRKPSL